VKGGGKADQKGVMGRTYFCYGENNPPLTELKSSGKSPSGERNKFGKVIAPNSPQKKKSLRSKKERRYDKEDLSREGRELVGKKRKVRLKGKGKRLKLPGVSG